MQYHRRCDQSQSTTREISSLSSIKSRKELTKMMIISVMMKFNHNRNFIKSNLNHMLSFKITSKLDWQCRHISLRSPLHLICQHESFSCEFIQPMVSIAECATSSLSRPSLKPLCLCLSLSLKLFCSADTKTKTKTYCKEWDPTLGVHHWYDLNDHHENLFFDSTYFPLVRSMDLLLDTYDTVIQQYIIELFYYIVTKFQTWCDMVVLPVQWCRKTISNIPCIRPCFRDGTFKVSGIREPLLENCGYIVLVHVDD